MFRGFGYVSTKWLSRFRCNLLIQYSLGAWIPTSIAKTCFIQPSKIVSAVCAKHLAPQKLAYSKTYHTIVGVRTKRVKSLTKFIRAYGPKIIEAPNQQYKQLKFSCVLRFKFGTVPLNLSLKFFNLKSIVGVRRENLQQLWHVNRGGDAFLCGLRYPIA